MSADQKKPETSPAADKLALYWQQFKQGKLISYRVMAVILLVVAGIGLWLYIRSEKKVGASKAWFELETANTESALKDILDKNPGSEVAKVARLHLARNQLGPEGIDKLSEARDEASRKQAVESIKKAQESLKQLADESGNSPVIRAECYLGLAKAEAALIGVTKEGSTDLIGSIEKTTEWLDKLAEVAEGTPWGEEAKKLSASLKDPSKKTQNELTSVQQAVYKFDSFGTPGSSPLSPGGFPTGGLPPIPGISGGPFTPTIPEVTPAPPSAGPPTGVGTAPIPPSVSPLVPGQQPSTPAPPPQPTSPPPQPPKK